MFGEIKMAKKTKQIKLDRYEQNNLDVTSEDNIIYLDNKTYFLCHVEQNLPRKLRGKRKTYFVIELDEKTQDYIVHRKTLDMKMAQWSINNITILEWQKEAFQILAGAKKAVKPKLGKRGKHANDVILHNIFSNSYHINDDDNETVYNAKRSLATARPSDFKVVIWPSSDND